MLARHYTTRGGGGGGYAAAIFPLGEYDPLSPRYVLVVLKWRKNRRIFKARRVFSFHFVQSDLYASQQTTTIVRRLRVNPTTHDWLRLSWTCPWWSKICRSCDWPIIPLSTFIVTVHDKMLLFTFARGSPEWLSFLKNLQYPCYFWQRLHSTTFYAARKVSNKNVWTNNICMLRNFVLSYLFQGFKLRTKVDLFKVSRTSYFLTVNCLIFLHKSSL